MKFRECIPDYKSYTLEDKYMNSVPNGVWSELSGLVLRASTSDSNLVSILNHFAEIIPCDSAQTWSGGFLREESREFVDRIRAKTSNDKFYVFMDCLAVLHTVGQLSADEINEFLEENKIGYYRILY